MLNQKNGLKEEREELLALLEKAREQEKLIIVEGKEDRLALERLGLTRIRVLNKKPLFQVVEEAIKENPEIIILTDLDRKGKQLYGKLNHALSQHGAKIDNKLREFIFRRTKLRQIEGMYRYCCRLEH
ncbi:toprim domain-containing protein [Candidatus Woesearchaeota archaeon]|nr:toprim domain-containing protein [Candidatus Woesearchaeota archaeon]